MKCKQQLGLMALLAAAALFLVPQATGQDATGIRTLEQQAAPLEPPPPVLSPYHHLPRPCPPTVESCPPAGYPCGLVPPDSLSGTFGAGLKSWLFRRYAGTYEMKTKLPYPPGYYGNYYFRPWVPGYVRQEPHDFQPGVYERPFYHHVDYYPHESIPPGTLGQPVEIHGTIEGEPADPTFDE